MTLAMAASRPWTTLSQNSSSASYNGRNTGEYKKIDPLV